MFIKELVLLLDFNYARMAYFIKELESKQEDNLYYVEEAMQDCLSLEEQIKDLICEESSYFECLKTTDDIINKICELYEEYKQKSENILGFRDYGWKF